MFPERLLGSKRATFLFALTVFVTTVVQVLTVPMIALLGGQTQWGLPVSDTLAVVLLVVGCAIQAGALMLADRWPKWAVASATLIYLALAIGLGVPSWLIGMYLVVALALFLLATRCSTTTSILWAVGVVFVSMSTLYIWLLAGAGDRHVVTGYILGETTRFAAPVLGATVLGIWWGARVRRVTLAREEAALATQEHALRVREAQEAERARLAHELHDVVGQHLAGLTTLADAALTMAPIQPEYAVRLMAEVRSEGRFAAVSLAGVLSDLRAAGTDFMDPDSGLQGVSGIIAYWRRIGIEVEADVSSGLGELPPVVSSTISRALQEALTNAAKYAPGAAVTVRIRSRDRGLELVVENDRPSEPVAPLPGIGLGWGIEGVRERVQLLHGTLTAEETPAGGWRLRLMIPLGTSAEGEEP